MFNIQANARRPALNIPNFSTGLGGGGAGGSFRFVTFYLPLNDLGAGVVDLTPSRALGGGTPTFTRATTAWTKLSSGLWASVASGQPRSAYIGMNTVATAYGGYLSEGARTQLVTPTASIRDMTNATWIKVTMTTAKTATGIDGAANSATTITATGANSTILQTLVAAATSRTYSCWIRRRTGTGTVILKQGTATLDITALINSATFTLVQLNDNELNVAYGLQINTSGDALDVDFNQFEAATFASTPLDTAGGTRNKDALTYLSSGNFSETGTGYAEFTTVNASVTWSNQTIFNDNAGVGWLYAQGNVTRTGSFITASSAALGLASGAQIKLAGTWDKLASGRTVNATNGVLTSATGNSSASVVTSPFFIGSDPTSGQLYGTTKNVRIYGVQLPDSTLQSMTT